MGMTNSENTAIYSTNICKTKIEEEKNKSSNFLFLFVLSFTVFIFFVSWHLFSGSWILKSIIVGSLLVGYSWELIYFDSIRPGIEPSSPLSPPHVKITSRYSLHFNYVLATFIGVSVSVFIGSFI